MSALSNLSGAATFLCYHSVAAEGPTWLSLPPDTFERQLALLRRRGYEGATTAQLAALAGGARPARPHVFLTFDDGYRDNHATALPLLRAYGLRALVFVLPPLLDAGGPLDWPGVEEDQRRFPDVMRSMTWSMVEELAEAGIEIGSHSLTHARLDRLGAEELTQELGDSRRRLADRLGSCHALAYPYGAWSPGVARAAARAGYRFAFTIPSSGQLRAHRLAIPRLPVDFRDDERRFSLKLRPVVRAALLSPARAIVSRVRGGAR